jgi:hypothetical protein
MTGIFVMLRNIWNVLSSASRAVFAEIDRCLERAGDDSDPSLWRLRPGAESAFDMSPRDDADRDHDRPHIPSI